MKKYIEVWKKGDKAGQWDKGGQGILYCVRNVLYVFLNTYSILEPYKISIVYIRWNPNLF